MAEAESFASFGVSSVMVEDFDFMTVPVKALNVSSRSGLSSHLNPELTFLSSKGEVRDYRGLAEQMGFDYNDIKNFRRNEDPTSKIIEAWEVEPNTSIGTLLEYLGNMDRYDVLEDLMPVFKRDARAYAKKMKALSDVPIQVAEVTPGPSGIYHYHPENHNTLTIGDAKNGGPIFYDAYICYAQKDFDFAMKLAHYLESPQVGMRLFIKDRDLLVGMSELEAHAQLIQERCRRMAILLSPEFLRSPEYEFQTKFAAGLAMEQKNRMLLPIVIVPCEVPPILRFISKIDFTKPIIPSFHWNRLIMSINGATSTIFMNSKSSGNDTPALECSQSSNALNYSFDPVIAYPPTEMQTDPLPGQQSLESENTEEQSLQRSAVNVFDDHQKATPSPKMKWFGRIKGVLRPNPSSSSVSAASSGYVSNTSSEIQEDNQVESIDDDFYPE